MSHNSSEQTIPPMRRYLDEIIQPIIGVSADRRCWEMLITAKIAKAAPQPTNWSRALTGRGAWPPDCREAFPSEEVFMLLVQKLEHRDYDSFLYKLTKLCDNLQKEHLNNSLITASSDFLKALNTFFSKSTDDAVQLQLLALGVQAVLCFLTETETDQHFWESKAAAIVQQNNPRRTKGDPASPILVDSLAQTIYKNSCAQYAQLLGSYKGNLINQDLCPGLTTDISSSAQIIGDGGAGKTTYLLIHFRKLLSAYEMDSLNNPIPIYVPLGQYRGMAVNGDRFIQSYIASNYANTPMEQFKLEATRYVLLLDGANESPCTDQLGNEIQQLVNLGCQMLITSRYKLEWKCLKAFSCVRINELSDAQIENALSKKGLPMAEGRLLQTLRRPMWLALYLGIENVDGINTPGEILREHHKWLLSKVAEDVQGAKYTKRYTNALDNFHRLAATTKTVVFNDEDIPFGEKSFFPDNDAREDFLMIGTATGLLKHLGNDPHRKGILYQWGHEYYLDFYTSYHIFSLMRTGKLVTILEEGLISTAVASLIGDLYGEYRYETKASCEEGLSPIENWLQLYMRHDDIESNITDESRQLATKNLVEVMKIARQNSITACFDGLDLSLTQFYDCSLPNSTFHNAIIPEAAFVAQGHTYQVRYIAHSNANNLLITAGDDKQVLFWDTRTGKAKATIKTTSRIKGLDISPDDKHLLILLDGCAPAVMIVSLCNYSTDTPVNISDETLKYSFAKFTSNPDYIICATEEGTIHIRNTKTGILTAPAVQVAIGRYGAPIEYGISSNRKFLAHGTMGGDILIRNISSLNTIKTLHQYDPYDDFCVHNVVFTHNTNGQYCVVKSEDCFIAWNIANPNEKIKSPEIAPGNCLFQVVPAPEGVFFFDYMTSSLFFWNISINQFREKNFPTNISGIAISHHLQKIIVGDEKQKLYFVEVDNCEITHTMWVGYSPKKSHPSHSCHYLGAGDVLFRRTWAGFFELYNTNQKRFVRIPVQPKPLSDAPASFFRGHWHYLEGYLCYTDGTDCTLWNLSTGCFVQSIELGFYSIEAVMPQAGVVVGSNSLLPYPLCIWALSSGKLIETIDRYGKRNFSPPKGLPPVNVHQDSTSTVAEPNNLRSISWIYATISSLGFVIGGSEDGWVKIWRAGTHLQLVHEEKVFNARITRLSPLGPSGEIVILAEDYSIMVFSAIEKCALGVWQDENNILSKSTFLKFIRHESRDTLSEAKCHEVGGTPIYRLILQQGTLVALKEDTLSAQDFSLSLNREWLAFLRPYSNEVQLYSVMDGRKKVFSMKSQRLWPCCAFAPSCDGKTLMISSESGSVNIVECERGKNTYEWPTCDAKDILNCDFTGSVFEKRNIKQYIAMNGGKI